MERFIFIAEWGTSVLTPMRRPRDPPQTYCAVTGKIVFSTTVSRPRIYRGARRRTVATPHFTHTRANYVAAVDMIEKIKAIAAIKLGGSADEYDIADERVFAKADPDTSLSYARVAEAAIELGGVYDGSDVADELHDVTKASVSGLRGTGLIGVAKDTMGRTWRRPGLAVGFVEIELDLETGKYDIIDYLGVADCGTVVHPMGLAGQIRSGAVWGIWHGWS